MKTTRESIREESHRQVVRSLQELLKKNYEAEKDFKKAVERADEMSLKDFCKQSGIRHNHFATEIDKLLHDLNEHPNQPKDHFDLHKAWTNFKTSIGKNGDDALLSECLHSEKEAVKEYREKLSKFKFPGPIDEVLNKQLKETETLLAEVESLEDLI
ncbi:MAG: PA2169 family four-helix-bundle protein [Salinimicrobium sp.]